MRDMDDPIRDARAGVAGVVLAAGAGTRFGMPKALARTPDGRPWVEIAAERLRAAGCSPVIVVLGAGLRDGVAEPAGVRAHEAQDGALPESRRGEFGDPRESVPAWAEVAVAEDWADGQSASLLAGLAAVAETEVDAVLITLVDLPGASPEAERRVLGALAGTASLARAVDSGRPAHPVLIGRDHWRRLAD